MKENIEYLRIKFQAETDIEITKDNISEYEKWLENIKVIHISNEIIIENRYLKNKMIKAMDIIYEGISSIPNKS